MSAPAIGGKVLDASSITALARGRIAALAWLAVARRTGIALYLPSLALTEVQALHPHTGPLLEDLISHPWVLLGQLDDTTTTGVEDILTRASAADPAAPDVEVVDVLAAHVVHTARARGWPVLTTDPARLQRLDPDIEVELL